MLLESFHTTFSYKNWYKCLDAYNIPTKCLVNIRYDMETIIFTGNDMLHRLTSLKPQELRVDIERFNGEKAYAVYSSFSVGDEANKYILRVQGYSGNAG